MPRKPGKKKTRSRPFAIDGKPNNITAVYTGPTLGDGLCKIGKCGHAVHARNLESARELMQEHLAIAHNQSEMPK